MLGLTFSSKLDWVYYIIYIAKTSSKKIGALIYYVFLLRLFCISINLPYGHAWNTVAMSGLVLLVANWNCSISYKSRYAGLLVLHLLPFLNPGLIVEMQPAQIFSIGITFVDVDLKWLNCFHFFYSRGIFTHFSDKCHDFSVTIPRCYKDVCVNRVIP